jgi:two-component system alkaline phosphatase synthesis response regulator PhoP
MENHNPLIFLIDDDPVLVRTLPAQLRRSSYRVETGCSINDLKDLLRQEKPDLILLDVVLPDGDGRAACRKLGSHPLSSAIPVILISASKPAEIDQARGVEAGALDYLVKPLHGRLLRAKIAAVLRRNKVAAQQRKVLADYGLALDVKSRSVSVGGRRVALTRKEFDLLAAFLDSRGRVLSPTELLESVWGYDTSAYSERRTVEVHVSSLRRKLGEAFASRLKAVPSHGYCLD